MLSSDKDLKVSRSITVPKGPEDVPSLIRAKHPNADGVMWAVVSPSNALEIARVVAVSNQLSGSSYPLRCSLKLLTDKQAKQVLVQPLAVTVEAKVTG